MSEFLSEDGGAFAECFYAQYPLNMGRKSMSFVVKTPLPTGVESHAPSVLSSADQTSACVRDPVSVDSGALVVRAKPVSGSLISLSAEEKKASDLALTTAKTREALEKALKSRQPQEEDFSGRNIRRVAGKKPVMDIIIPGEVGVAGAYDPAPIVRSPTRSKTGSGFGGDGEKSGTSSETTTSVPFSIGNWKNKRKLIIPLEQRLMQQADPHASSVSGGGAISDSVMELALAMQQAKQDVEKVLSAREKARQEEEERLQAEREAEATQRAKELLERTAAQKMNSSSAEDSQQKRRRETREERLERIRLERELRDREKVQEVRQRRLAKAAARLGMTVEALEADEELLRTVDETEASGVDASKRPVAAQATRSTAVTEAAGTGDRPASAFEDNDEAVSGRGGIRKGVFGSAVISNDGVRREMEALAKLEEEERRRGGPQTHDGIRMQTASDEEEDEDDSGLGMGQIMRKKKRRL